MTEPVVVVQHQDFVSEGWVGEVLERAGAVVRTVHLGRGERLPEDGGCSAVVVLGGEMGAYDEELHPFLGEEKRYLARMVGRGVPVLGICLGAQLLADALGGRAFRAESLEMGYLVPELTDEGRRDPVLSRLGGPVLSWHFDTFELPPGARLLARSTAYPQAFRRGCALGIQFHPEATPAMVERWVENVGAERLRQAGGDPEGVVAEARRRAEEIRVAGQRMLQAWIDEDLRPAGR